ncbi:MAG: DNA polymerase III subunit beta, partial [Muribaculaceae bacterium]|nr:DNA polymerase III subunit beta [Muribaculaceae bacterium]
MKFVVQSKAFYNAASAVGKVISSKNALIILDNFLLELKDGKLTLTGSDTDSTLSAGIELSDSEGEGKICLSSRTLSNLLKELPDQEVTFNINDSTLEVEITYPGGTFNLVGINGNEFPEYRAPEDQAEPVKIVTEGKRISKAFDYTLFAVATEDFRAQMQGVYFDIFEDHINFVATAKR